MLAVDDPSELVRLYDGADNPIGKCYTLPEIRAMIPTELQVLETKRFGLPRRALPLPLPTAVHRVLCHYFGLMIAVRCRRVAGPTSAPSASRPMRRVVNKS
jgi:hypothetical protein